MLFVALLTNGKALTGKPAGRTGADPVMTAAVKTKLTTAPAATTLTEIAVATAHGPISLNRNSQ
jgi:hypothetical protein